MNILLAYTSGQPDRSDPYISLMPTGVCSLHAVLREKGYNSLLANFSGWSKDDIDHEIRRYTPVLVGISQWTHNRHACLELARQVRDILPAALIVFGGAHATFSPEELLGHHSPLDCVVLGEGEATLLELANRLNNGQEWHDVPGIACLRHGKLQISPSRTPLKDLDLVPHSARYLEYSVGVDLQLQPEFIITARGCPSACHFCSSPRLWDRSVRFRSPHHIVDEIEYIRQRYGLIYFSLRDDTFTADRARTIEFCRLLIERRLFLLWNCQSRVTSITEELLLWMKRAGCECIQLGVESGSERVLKRLGKAISPAQVVKSADLVRKVGINLSIYLISDIPGETEEDVRDTIRLVRRISPDDGYISPLAYFPGTRIFEEAVLDGRVSRDVFQKNSGSAVFVSDGKNSRTQRLLDAVADSGKYDAGRFAAHKQMLGYCYTTNVLAGENYRWRGDLSAAERELREITEKEPENPWGWYLLAELYRDVGRKAKATACYQAVLRLVPGHQSSIRALQAKKKRG